MYIYHPASKSAFYIGRSSEESWYVGTLKGLLCDHLALNLTDFFYDTSVINNTDDYNYGDTSFKIMYETDEWPDTVIFFDDCKKCLKNKENPGD